VLDARVAEVGRASGQPRKADVLARTGAGASVSRMQPPVTVALVKRRVVDLCRMRSSLCPSS